MTRVQFPGPHPTRGRTIILCPPQACCGTHIFLNIHTKYKYTKSRSKMKGENGVKLFAIDSFNKGLLPVTR